MSPKMPLGIEIFLLLAAAAFLYAAVRVQSRDALKMVRETGSFWKKRMPSDVRLRWLLLFSCFYFCFCVASPLWLMRLIFGAGGLMNVVLAVRLSYKLHENDQPSPDAESVQGVAPQVQ